MLLQDKNGTEIRTGDIVRVTGAYFKQDNRVYYVDTSPGDTGWFGLDYSLHALNSRTGELSRTKYNIAFWPLTSYVSDRFKTLEANQWNREHAQIEVIYDVNARYVYEYFIQRAESEEEAMNSWRCSTFPSERELHMKRAEHFRAVAERIRSRCIEQKDKWIVPGADKPSGPIDLDAFAQKYASLN